MKKDREFDNFSGLLKRIVKTPHEDVKAKLEAEKKDKAEHGKAKRGKTDR